jgi:hypothetical protein
VALAYGWVTIVILSMVKQAHHYILTIVSSIVFRDSQTQGDHFPRYPKSQQHEDQMKQHLSSRPTTPSTLPTLVIKVNKYPSPKVES